MVLLIAPLCACNGITQIESYRICGDCADSGVAETTADGSEVDAVDAAVSAESACAERAKQLCALLSRCSPIDLSANYASEAACRDRVRKVCLFSLAAPGTTLTPAAVLTCAQVVGAGSCEDLINGVRPDACRRKPGPRPNGTKCGYDEQCASVFCEVPGGVRCGTCTAAPKPGESCKSSRCDISEVCAGGKCVKGAGAGEACSATLPCAYPNACAADDTCKPLRREGEACVLSGDTPCDTHFGLFCPADALRCTKVKIVAVGEPCGLGTSEMRVCAGLGACGGAGKCVARLADDTGTCSGGVAEGTCLTGATCVSSTSRCELVDGSLCK